MLYRTGKMFQMHYYYLVCILNILQTSSLVVKIILFNADYLFCIIIIFSISLQWVVYGTLLLSTNDRFILVVCGDQYVQIVTRQYTWECGIFVANVRNVIFFLLFILEIQSPNDHENPSRTFWHRWNFWCSLLSVIIKAYFEYFLRYLLGSLTDIYRRLMLLIPV